METATETEFLDAWEAFMRAARRARGRDAQRAGADISLAQFHLLEPLLEGPAPMRDLRNAAGVSYPTATRMVDALAEHGIVTRSQDPQDKRVVVVELTEAGRERLEAKATQVAGARRRIAAQLSEQERTQGAALLRRLTEAVEDL